jgi:hypothetical protein
MPAGPNDTGFGAMIRPTGKRVLPHGRVGMRGLAALGAWMPVGPRSQVHAKAHRCEVPMSEGHFFSLGPRVAPVEPFFDKGYPGRLPSSASRARLPGKSSGTREAAGRAFCHHQIMESVKFRVKFSLVFHQVFVFPDRSYQSAYPG